MILASIYHLSFPCGSVEGREIAIEARENAVWGTSDTGRTFDRMASICLRMVIEIASSEGREKEHQASASLEERETTSSVEIFFEGKLPCGTNGHRSDSSFVHSYHALSSSACACQFCSQVSCHLHLSVYASCAFCHLCEPVRAY